MLRMLIGTAAAIVLYTGAAHAQFGSANGNTGVGNGGLSGGMIPDGRRRLTPEEAHREQQIEREYRETVNSKIPDKKGSNGKKRESAPPPLAWLDLQLLLLLLFRLGFGLGFGLGFIARFSFLRGPVHAGIALVGVGLAGLRALFLPGLRPRRATLNAGGELIVTGVAVALRGCAGRSDDQR